MSERRNRAIELMNNNMFTEALVLFTELIDEGNDDSGLYHMAGQCYRYTGDIQNAITYHKKSVEIDPKYPSYHLALGIAYQLNEQYKESHEVLSDLILNHQQWENLDLAFNSVALTQKKMGLYERSKKNYEQGIKVHLRNIMQTFVNSKDNEVLNIEPTTYNLWYEYAIESALYFAMSFDEDIGGIGFLEKEDSQNKGLYWTVKEIDSSKTLILLPNFFAKIREELPLDSGYFNFIGNLSSVLKENGDTNEAEKYLMEANEFLDEYNSMK